MKSRVLRLLMAVFASGAVVFGGAVGAPVPSGQTDVGTEAVAVSDGKCWDWCSSPED